ncbi:MAG: hypothetical protein ACK5QT_03930, partial [Oligoflexia bacterium]
MKKIKMMSGVLGVFFAFGMAFAGGAAAEDREPAAVRAPNAAGESGKIVLGFSEGIMSYALVPDSDGEVGSGNADSFRLGYRWNESFGLDFVFQRSPIGDLLLSDQFSLVPSYR